MIGAARLLTGSVRGVWTDVMTPSKRLERGHYAGAIAGTHALLGAALVDLSLRVLPELVPWIFPLATPWVLPLVVALLYWGVKERVLDRRRGGGWIDGLADGGFVALGAFGVAPVVIMALVCVESIRKEARFLAVRAAGDGVG